MYTRSSGSALGFGQRSELSSRWATISPGIRLRRRVEVAHFARGIRVLIGIITAPRRASASQVIGKAAMFGSITPTCCVRVRERARGAPCEPLDALLELGVSLALGVLEQVEREAVGCGGGGLVEKGTDVRGSGSLRSPGAARRTAGAGFVALEPCRAGPSRALRSSGVRRNAGGVSRVPIERGHGRAERARGEHRRLDHLARSLQGPMP